MSRIRHFYTTALLVLWVAGCSGGAGSSSSPTSPPPPAPPDTVTIQVLDFEFTPRSVTVNAGTTVRWEFHGQNLSHTSTAKDMTWDSGFVFQQVGDAFVWTTTSEDNGKTFEYSCRSHSASHEMKGSILVGASAPPPEPGY